MRKEAAPTLTIPLQVRLVLLLLLPSFPTPQQVPPSIFPLLPTLTIPLQVRLVRLLLLPSFPTPQQVPPSIFPLQIGRAHV